MFLEELHDELLQEIRNRKKVEEDCRMIKGGYTNISSIDLNVRSSKYSELSIFFKIGIIQIFLN